MGGGVGALVIGAVALAAVVAAMLLVLNARWKTGRQQLQEARDNFVGTAALLAIALVALGLVAFVVSEML